VIQKRKRNRKINCSEGLAGGIKYSVNFSKRARKLKIALHYDGRCVATVPFGFSERVVRKFIEKKSDWLLDHLKYFESVRNSAPRNTSGDFSDNKEKAFILARERVDYFNRFYGFSVGKINIRAQKTRWGSCSRKGNLNFNYRIAHLPRELSDYIIIHELCHLGSFDHSKRFWDLVEKTAPNHAELRRRLKIEGIRYG